MVKWKIAGGVLAILLAVTLALVGSFFVVQLVDAISQPKGEKVAQGEDAQLSDTGESENENNTGGAPNTTEGAEGVTDVPEENPPEGNPPEENPPEENPPEENPPEENPPEENPPEENPPEENPPEEDPPEEPPPEENPPEEDPPEEDPPVMDTPEYTLPDGVSISGSHAFVYDYSNAGTLYAKGSATEHIAPASITKLFTAYVALQYLPGDKVLTAGSEVNMVASDASRAWIYNGQKITVDMCVQGMLMCSGSDAAYILAASAGRTIKNDENLSVNAAIAAFVEEMNRQAQALGLDNTHFVNPDGIDAEGHYTCLQDLMLIACLAIENPVIRKHIATSEANVTYASGEISTWKNTNLLLHTNSKYYNANACGLKTGSTDNAGYCLLAAFRHNGSYVFICIMGCEDEKVRYQDVLALYEVFCN